MAETISSLRQNQSVYRIFMKIILVLTLGIGFIIGNLSAKQRQKELEEYKKYVKTKKFVEEVAKNKFGLLYPDEILIKPDD